MECSQLISLLVGVVAKHGDIEVYVNVGERDDKVRVVVDLDDCRDSNGTRFVALDMGDIVKAKYDLNR